MRELASRGRRVASPEGPLRSAAEAAGGIERRRPLRLQLRGASWREGSELLRPGRGALRGREATSPGPAAQDAPADALQASATGPMCTEPPQAEPSESTSSGFTRARFLRALMPWSALTHGSPEELMTYAKEQELIAKGGAEGRPHDPVTRAESAIILSRYLELDSVEPGDSVCYFADVGPSAWFFAAAHQCRLFGVYRGTDTNYFLPHTPLSEDVAMVVLGRLAGVRRWNRDEQAEHLSVAPLLEPSELASLLARDRLSAEEIGLARDLIAQEPAEKRGDLYEQLQSKVKYNNQRDARSSAERLGGGLCNLTSLAMCLEYLGIPNPHPEMEYEDALEKVRVDNGFKSRESMEGWSAVARKLGADTGTIASDELTTKDFWDEDVRDAHLRQGHAVMLSVKGHIVRVQGVTSGGLEVDDPYGVTKLGAGYAYGFDAYNGGSYAGGLRPENPDAPENFAGEDNVWPWSEVLAHRMWWIQWFSV